MPDTAPRPSSNTAAPEAATRPLDNSPEFEQTLGNSSFSALPRNLFSLSP
jgi:hypothetical protein